MRKQQKLFAEEYIIDLHGTNAAIRAGYSKKTATVQASTLLTKLNIQKYIRELQREKMERNKVTADMVIQELALLAFSDVGNLFVDNSLKHISDLPKKVTRTIQEVTSKIDVTGTGEDKKYAEIIKIKNYDKKGALDSLGKHFGIFEKDNKPSGDGLINKIQIEFIEPS